MKRQQPPSNVVKTACKLICYPVYLPYRQFIRPWRQKREARSQEEWDLARRSPTTPEKRERALSIELADPAQQLTLAQTESLFLLLPAELRNKVYAECMCYEGIYLFREINRFRAFGQHRSDHQKSGWLANVLPLLQTCRQVYSEALPLLYSTPTFFFSNPPDFISFTSSILPQRFTLLSRITMSTGPSDGDCRLPPAVSSRLDYRTLAPYPRILNALPTIEPGIRESFWALSCTLMARLHKLRFLKLVVEDAPPLECGTVNYVPLFGGLNRLKREGMDVQIQLKGQYIRRTYMWRSKEGEAVWLGESGEVVWRRESSAAITWWEEWGAIEEEMKGTLRFVGMGGIN